MSRNVDFFLNAPVSGNTDKEGGGTEYRLVVDANGYLQVEIVGGGGSYPYNAETDDDNIPIGEVRETVIAILYAKDPTGNMERVLTDGLGKIQTTATVISPGAYNPQNDDDSVPIAESHESNIALLYGISTNPAPDIWQRIKTDDNGRMQIADGGGSITVDGTFWQGTQPISAAALPLPAGASTSAIQTTMNTSLDEIEDAIENLEEALQSIGTDYLLIGDAGSIINLDAAGHAQIDVVTMPVVAVTGTFWQGTQPISAAALPLPAGASTSANQTTIIGHLNALDDALESIGTDSLLSTIEEGGRIAEVQTDLVSNVVGANADVGLVTKSFLFGRIQATNNSAAIRVDGSANLQTVLFDGAAPMSIAADGYVTLTSQNAIIVTGVAHGEDLDVGAGNSEPFKVRTEDGAIPYGDKIQSVAALMMGDDGTDWHRLLADASGHLQIDVISAPTTAVTGTFWQGTQPVSLATIPAFNAENDDGSIPAGESRETQIILLHGYDDVAGIWERLRTDASNSLWVNVTNTVPVSGTFWQGTQPISAAALPLPAGASTSANQTTIEATLTNIEKATRAINTDWLLIGDAGSIINLDAGGDVQVDVKTMPSVAVTGTFWPTLIAATSLAVPDLDGVSLLPSHALMSARIDVNTTVGLLADASGHLQIDVISAPTTAVTGTFWQGTQPISAAALPLPAGASTSAIQTTMNTSLDEIEDAIENLEEALQSIGTDYLLIGDAGSIINLDAGGDVQVDVKTMPVVAVTGTFWQATQPVSLASIPAYNPETDDGQIPDGEVHDSVIAVLYAYNTSTTDLKRVLVNDSGALMVYTP